MTPSLTLGDSVQLHRRVMLPTFLGGLVAPSRHWSPILVRRRAAAGIHTFLTGIRKKYGPRVWTRLPVKPTLVVLDGPGIDTVLASDRNFADPWLKKWLVSRFAPFSLTISGADAWHTRRPLNEAVLAFDQREHPDAAAFLGIVNAEVNFALDQQRKVLIWDDFSELAARISQQVVFGVDRYSPVFANQLARLVSASNRGFRRHENYRAFRRRLDAQFDGRACRNAPAGLMCRLAQRVTGLASPGDAEPSGQAAFWLFVMKDALELHTVRTLALISQASDEVKRKLLDEIGGGEPATAAGLARPQLLDACIAEQLRLWTPVPVLLRVANDAFELDDIRIAKGQQLLLHTGFYHRDPEVFGATADRFSPEHRVMRRGGPRIADSCPPLFVLSRHHQSCVGEFLVTFLLKAVLVALLRRTWFELLDQPPSAHPIPAAVDPFAMRFWLREHSAADQGPTRR